MYWLKPCLFVVVFLSGFVQSSCGRAHSNSEIVQIYEQCVLNKLSKSQFFTDEDRLRMVKIVGETNQRTHLLHLNPTDASNMRTMLRLFTAALANLVADNQIPENFQRKEVYLYAIELCSLSLPELIADELIREITRIFASMRNDRHLYAVNSGNESPVSFRRRKRSLETSSNLMIFGDNLSKLRYNRSPQGETLNPFRGWVIHQPLETVISNTLLNSPVFSNVFKIGTTQQDALYYSRNMIQSGMGDYAFSIISESMNAAANALSLLNSRANTANYALAIANSIASVLKNHHLAFFADGNEIGNALLQKLQELLGTNTPPLYIPPNLDSSSSFTWASNPSSLIPNQPKMTSTARINSGFGEAKQAANISPNFQSDTSIFKNTLEYFLSQSNKLQGAFCSSPFSGAFGMVKEALSGYGVPISMTAANSVMKLLGSMNSNDVCNQYASAIAETVANILRDNHLLQNANAVLIVQRMESNINLSFDMKAIPIRNQQGSQPFRSSFDNFQQSPSFFSEFSSSDVQYPNPVLSPVNPMGGMTFEDTPESPILFRPPESIQVSPPRTEVLNKSPEIYPSFEYPNADYSSIFSESDSDTAVDSSYALKPNDQTTEHSSLSKTEVSGDLSFGIPNVPMDRTLINNSKLGNSSQNMTSFAYPLLNPEIIMEPGPLILSNISVKMETVPFRTEGNVNSNSTTLSSLEETRSAFTENSNIQSSTLSIIETTTAPTPYITTIIDSTTETRKFEYQQDDVYLPMRVLDIVSKPDESEFAPDTVTTIKTSQPPSTQEPTSENLNQGDKLGSTPSVTMPTLIESSTVSAFTSEESVELQPSFSLNSSPVLDILAIASNSSDETYSMGTRLDDVEFEDPNFIFAEHITSVASTTIALIRSGKGNLPGICEKLNELAPVVDIPPLDICNEMALIDYILNVLKAVTFILKGV